MIVLLEEDPFLEEWFIESNFVSKIRGAAECFLGVLPERIMKYFINLVRVFREPSLVAQAFNDFILSPFMMNKMTDSARNLCLDFVSVYFNQLTQVEPFSKNLTKRMILIEV